MVAKESLSSKKYYSKCLFILALMCSVFCWNTPIALSSIQNQKIQTESVIGFKQQHLSQLQYKVRHRVPSKIKVDAAYKVIYACTLCFYNKTVLVFLNQHQSEIRLFQPFRYFPLPKIIPPFIDSYLSV